VIGAAVHVAQDGPTVFPASDQLPRSCKLNVRLLQLPSFTAGGILVLSELEALLRFQQATVVDSGVGTLIRMALSFDAYSYHGNKF
jgi:hypothetical protein